MVICQFIAQRSLQLMVSFGKFLKDPSTQSTIELFEELENYSHGLSLVNFSFIYETLITISLYYRLLFLFEGILSTYNSSVVFSNTVHTLSASRVNSIFVYYPIFLFKKCYGGFSKDHKKRMMCNMKIIKFKKRDNMFSETRRSLDESL